MKLAVYLGFALVVMSFASDIPKEELSDITNDEVEQKLIQEWKFCSRFCRRACRWRFFGEQEKISLCLEYACGCKVTPDVKPPPEKPSTPEEPSKPDEPQSPEEPSNPEESSNPEETSHPEESEITQEAPEAELAQTPAEQQKEVELEQPSEEEVIEESTVSYMGLPVLNEEATALPLSESVSSLEFTFLSLVVTFTLLWCLLVAGFKAYSKYTSEKEKIQSDYLILDDNDHYQRLY